MVCLNFFCHPVSNQILYIMYIRNAWSVDIERMKRSWLWLKRKCRRRHHAAAPLASHRRQIARLRTVQGAAVPNETKVKPRGCAALWWLSEILTQNSLISFLALVAQIFFHFFSNSKFLVLKTFVKLHFISFFFQNCF